MDIDGDGKPELLFNRSLGSSPLATVYHRSGAAWTPVFSVADTVSNWGPAHLRSATQFDLLETTPNDVRIRDVSGALLFRAATTIPGWTGAQPGPQLIDINDDGIQELLIEQVGVDMHMFKYAAGAFTQLWANAGWMEEGEFGTPGDTQPRLEMFNLSTGHYATFDATTGRMVREFTDFGLYNNSAFIPWDLTGDGKPEILLWRPASATVTPLFLALHWNGARYDTLFTHTDPIDNLEIAHLRSAAQSEIVEEVRTGPGNVRVRDSAGNVLLRASTGIPGWTGLSLTYTNPLDVDHDGVQELLINDGPVTRMVKYAGTFAQAWAAPSGWMFVGDVGNTDGDPQDELMLGNTATGVFAVCDGLTGVFAQTFPTFSYTLGGTFQTADLDHDGRNELLFSRINGFGQPPLVTKYQWNGSAYGIVYSYADSLSGFAVTQLRDNVLHELEEVSPSNDVVLRDAVSGAVLFKASADLAGWTGVDMNSGNPVGSADIDGNGVPELLLSEAGQVRFLRFGGAAGVAATPDRLAFRVLPNAPNPFRSATTLRFTLPRAGEVGVRIFDTAGRLVRRLDRTFPAGENEVRWDGRDDAGREAPSGVLVYEVRADGHTQTRKVVHMP